VLYAGPVVEPLCRAQGHVYAAMRAIHAPMFGIVVGPIGVRPEDAAPGGVVNVERPVVIQRVVYMLRRVVVGRPLGPHRDKGYIAQFAVHMPGAQRRL
jgi:hypothetical protein